MRELLRDSEENPRIIRMPKWILFFYLITIGLMSAQSLDILIVAPNEFKTPINQLVEHKRAMGWKCEFMSLETLRSMEGADDAERVKKALFLFYQKLGLQYVFIVGDSDKFPVRYSAQSADAPLGKPKVYEFTASDLYYADLEHHGDVDFGHPDGSFSSWNNSQGDYYDSLYWAQIHKENEVNYDQIDMVPEIAVGRLPASNVTEVQNYVEKVIAYERFPHGNKRSIIVGRDADIDSRVFTEKVADIFTNAGLFNNKIYSDDIEQIGDFCQDLEFPNVVWANMEFGAIFFALSAHGSPNGWSFFNDSDVYALNPTDGLPVMFLSSCDVGRFTVKSDSIYLDIENEAVIGSGGILNTLKHNSVAKETNTLALKFVSDPINGERNDVEGYAYEEHSIAKMEVSVGGNRIEKVVSASPDYVENEGVRMTLHLLRDDAIFNESTIRLENRHNPHIDTGYFELSESPSECAVLATNDDRGKCIVEIFEIEPLGGGWKKVATWSKLGYHHTGFAAGDYDGDGKSEIVIWGQDTYKRERLIALEWESGSYISTKTWHDISAAETGNLQMGYVDDDLSAEVLVTMMDNNNQFTAFVYDILDGRGFSKKHEIRIKDATMESAIEMGNIDHQYREEIFISCKDSKNQLTTLIYETIPGKLELNRLGSIRFENCDYPQLSLGNVDDDIQNEIVFCFKDGLGRCREMIYNYDDVVNRFTRISDRAENIPSIPVALTMCDIGDDNVDEVSLIFYRSGDFPLPPNPIQPSKYDESCIVEKLLTYKPNTGAIAIVACDTGAQSWGQDLGFAFFDQYNANERIAGRMWKKAIIKYFETHERGSLEVTDNQRNKNERWTVGAEFFQPAKYTFFGDPSLIIP